eukprot:Hpha_TRINITY_DN14251_c0_g1::TRINITY_DN14251_c0_g1_i3::g.22670::m.22670
MCRRCTEAPRQKSTTNCCWPRRGACTFGATTRAALSTSLSCTLESPSLSLPPQDGLHWRFLHSSAVTQWETPVHWEVTEREGRLRASKSMLRRTGRGGCFIPCAIAAMLACVGHGNSNQTALVDVDVHAPDGHLGDLHGVLAHLTHQPDGSLLERQSGLVAGLRKKWNKLVLLTAHLTMYPEECEIPPVCDDLSLRFKGRGEKKDFTYARRVATMTENWWCEGCRMRFERKDSLIEHIDKKAKKLNNAQARHERLLSEKHQRESGSRPTDQPRRRKEAIIRRHPYVCTVEMRDGRRHFSIWSDAGKRDLRFCAAMDSIQFRVDTSSEDPVLILTTDGSPSAAPPGTPQSFSAQLIRGNSAVALTELRRLFVSHSIFRFDDAVEVCYRADIQSLRECSEMDFRVAAGEVVVNYPPATSKGTGSNKTFRQTAPCAVEGWAGVGPHVWERFWDRHMSEATKCDTLMVSLGMDIAEEEAGCGGKCNGWGFGTGEWEAFGRAVATAKSRSRVLFLEGGYEKLALERLSTVIAAVHAGLQEK